MKFQILYYNVSTLLVCYQVNDKRNDQRAMIPLVFIAWRGEKITIHREQIFAAAKRRIRAIFHPS